VTRDLRPLFAPSSVAVVGASADESKWGNVLARGALRGAHRRSVFLVNRAGSEILGERAYRSLAELPEVPELVVVCVPAPGFERAVDEALAVDARAIIGITTGLGEHDDEGKRIEFAVAERARAAGAVLLGPNCLGVFDAEEELDVGWSPLPEGSVALVSQSGNLALELARLAAASGLGFSRFASLGNQADLVAADFLDELAAHERTRAIALYLEDFRDGRAFVAAAARSSDGGTPVILLTGGVNPASARAARSHTGALVSEVRAIRAACAASGIVHVTTPKALVDAAQALVSGRASRGRRVAVYADGGGHGVVAGDVVAAAGLELPVLSEPMCSSLATHLPETATVANPVDFAGGGERGLALYADVGRLLLDSDEVDAVLLTGYFGGYGVDTPALAGEEIAAARSLAAAAGSYRALVVHSTYPESPAAVELRHHGVPVYGDIESAVAALALLADLAGGERVAPVEVELARLEPPGAGYQGAREFVAGAGVPMTAARRASTLDEALAAAEEIGYPVAVKAADRLHKSEAGGVVLGLADRQALERALRELDAHELSVEEMAPVGDGIELIVGSKRDPRFGPVVLVGLGGVYAEILDDVAVALAPIDDRLAEHLVRSLRAAPLLDGARGRPSLDVAAAARVVAAVSQAAAACPEVAELDVNPLLVLPTGALGLDARVLLGS
jgi:acetate---CoA ligase (ADP-forming)